MNSFRAMDLFLGGDDDVIRRIMEEAEARRLARQQNIQTSGTSVEDLIKAQREQIGETTSQLSGATEQMQQRQLAPRPQMPDTDTGQPKTIEDVAPRVGAGAGVAPRTPIVPSAPVKKSSTTRPQEETGSVESASSVQSLLDAIAPTKQDTGVDTLPMPETQKPLSTKQKFEQVAQENVSGLYGKTTELDWIAKQKHRTDSEINRVSEELIKMPGGKTPLDRNSMDPSSPTDQLKLYKDDLIGYKSGLDEVQKGVSSQIKTEDILFKNKYSLSPQETQSKLSGLPSSLRDPELEQISAEKGALKSQERDITEGEMKLKETAEQREAYAPILEKHHPYYENLRNKTESLGASQIRLKELYNGLEGGEVKKDSLATMTSQILQNGVFGYGINLSSYLTNPSTESWDAISRGLIEGANAAAATPDPNRPDAKSTLTGQQVSYFMQIMPSLSKSVEGNKAIIRNMLLLNEMDINKRREADKLLEENGGRYPENFRELLDDRTSATNDKLRDQFIAGTKPEYLNGVLDGTKNARSLKGITIAEDTRNATPDEYVSNKIETLSNEKRAKYGINIDDNVIKKLYNKEELTKSDLSSLFKELAKLPSMREKGNIEKATAVLLPKFARTVLRQQEEQNNKDIARDITMAQGELNAITTKEVPEDQKGWDPKSLRSFEEVRNAIISTPNLTMNDIGKAASLLVDKSDDLLKLSKMDASDAKTKMAMSEIGLTPKAAREKIALLERTVNQIIDIDESQRKRDEVTKRLTGIWDNLTKADRLDPKEIREYAATLTGINKELADIMPKTAHANTAYLRAVEKDLKKLEVNEKYIDETRKNLDTVSTWSLKYKNYQSLIGKLENNRESLLSSIQGNLISASNVPPQSQKEKGAPLEGVRNALVSISEIPTKEPQRQSKKEGSMINPRAIADVSNMLAKNLPMLDPEKRDRLSKELLVKRSTDLNKAISDLAAKRLGYDSFKGINDPEKRKLIQDIGSYVADELETAVSTYKGRQDMIENIGDKKRAQSLRMRQYAIDMKKEERSQKEQILKQSGKVDKEIQEAASAAERDKMFIDTQLRLASENRDNKPRWFNSFVNTIKSATGIDMSSLKGKTNEQIDNIAQMRVNELKSRSGLSRIPKSVYNDYFYSCINSEQSYEAMVKVARLSHLLADIAINREQARRVVKKQYGDVPDLAAKVDRVAKPKEDQLIKAFEQGVTDIYHETVYKELANKKQVSTREQLSRINELTGSPIRSAAGSIARSVVPGLSMMDATVRAALYAFTGRT